MSMFENDQYQWRDTYCVLFESGRRPKLKEVEKKLSSLGGRYMLANGMAGKNGAFESLTVVAPDDFAALDICFVRGEEVREQVTQILREMKASDLGPEDQAKLDRLRRCDARFDVLHFEQVVDAGDQEDELFDPSALILVLDALAELTDGIPVDPQAGTIL